MTIEQLKEEIDADITTNGNREITGAKLNGVLNDIVDTLDAEVQEVDAKFPNVYAYVDNQVRLEIITAYLGIPLTADNFNRMDAALRAGKLVVVRVPNNGVEYYDVVGVITSIDRNTGNVIFNSQLYTKSTNAYYYNIAVPQNTTGVVTMNVVTISNVSITPVNN